MTTFTELAEKSMNVPIKNFTETVEKDLEEARFLLKKPNFLSESEIERIQGIENASYNTLVIHGALIDNMGFNEESSMLFVGTIQAKQKEIKKSTRTKEFKESADSYYTDIITNYYVLISEVGKILGELKASFGFEIPEQEAQHHEHKHDHEESCSCDHCHV